MTSLCRRLLGIALLLFAVAGLAACSSGVKPANAKANAPLSNELIEKIAAIGSTPGAPTMMRIFKESNEFEVWKQAGNGEYRLLKTYLICAYSGGLGPKIVEGDRQSPEGFYNITPALMNPNSNYYLAFNTGFPNKFDRAWGRTGSDLMVHGDCSSRGCYSMTDASVAEIYALARETFKGGNPSFQLQIYPFRMTAENLAKHNSDPNMPFWRDIKQGYDRFEVAHAPASWDVCEKKYVFGTSGTAALDASAKCPDGTEVVPANVAAKAAADDAQVATLVAQATAKAAKDQAQATAAAKSDADAKARGEAIAKFFSGDGGAPAGGKVDPAVVAPVPAPQLNRA